MYWSLPFVNRPRELLAKLTEGLCYHNSSFTEGTSAAWGVSGRIGDLSLRRTDLVGSTHTPLADEVRGTVTEGD